MPGLKEEAAGSVKEDLQTFAGSQPTSARSPR